MADDTVEQARQWLHWHGKAQYGDKGLRLRMEEAARLLRELLDFRLTVVKLRDESADRLQAKYGYLGTIDDYIDAVLDERNRLWDSRLTVVKLRDDETSPVAAPCAIAGACQYDEAYENARVRLLNLTTTALADSEKG